MKKEVRQFIEQKRETCPNDYICLSVGMRNYYGYLRFDNMLIYRSQFDAEEKGVLCTPKNATISRFDLPLEVKREIVRAYNRLNYAGWEYEDMTEEQIEATFKPMGNCYFAED